MRGVLHPLFALVDRHKAAFAISATLVVIGVFAGLYYRGDVTVSDGVITLAVRCSFWSDLIRFFLPKGIILAGISVLGRNRLTACIGMPLLLIYQGFAIGQLFISNMTGLIALFFWTVVLLITGLCLISLYILAGMAGFSLAFEQRDKKDSYIRFFILLMIFLTVVSIYHALGTCLLDKI